ncbi:uncharacterized protein (TIGR04255 family) [Methanolinea mesophila]|uniref:hypothetical protein n=1 Tax=Methanolinea mesophila TaxID=547055 RepID=UPI001AEA6970|nr:hypothetical protein [Methanolinea mesophila]MBP1929987.1 uncharacterized protein (TIGR04255 family) [Methanolinea mesophila]
MDNPPAHSFSRSPVQEVFCLCTRGSDAEPLTLTVPRPYPGWPHIRGRITDMIDGAGEISRITGCTLQYTDLIPVVDGMELPGIEDIGRVLSGRFNCFVDTAKSEIMLIGTKIPDTEGSVFSMDNRPGTPGWTLIFTMSIERPSGFVSGESVVNWFDAARAGIHGLFDLIVPEEIVQSLR